jgi:serine/threonine protein kinase
MNSSSASSMTGMVVSHYTIQEKLGQGGMGVVYKAEDNTLKRTVALKFLPPQVSASQTDRARFLLEAQAAAALNHPNICTIYGIENTDDHSFIAMEFVDGQTLREKRASVNLAKAIEIGIQVADGLAVAHEKGITHRDIKPENIMVRKDGIVQIMDFGLAKLRASTASRLTREGSTVGTAGYMSPEQIQGQETDHRSDIFSLGVLLYELFTGELPFKGVHETALLYEIVNVDPAPMSTVKPEIDPELDRIVLECLQKDPDERYQGVKDISKDLKRFKRESSKQRMSRTFPVQRMSAAARPAVTASPESAPGRRYLWPAVAAVLFIALLVVSWRAFRPAPPPPVLHIPISLPIGTPLFSGASTLAISPDGSRLVFLADDRGISRLFLRSFDRFEATPIPRSEQGIDPFFSRDGQWVGYFQNGKLMKVSGLGGAPIEVCAIDGYPRGGYWTPDDMIYFGMINAGLFRVPASGGTPEAVTTLDSTNKEISHRYPSLLPDNKTVVYTIKQSNISTFDDAIIAAENVETHKRTILVRGGTFAKYFPAGYLLYSRGESIWAAVMDPGSVSLTSQPVAVATGGMMNPFSGIGNFDIADNGTFLYSPVGAIRDLTMKLAWIRPDGTRQALLDSLRSYGYCSLSPDGTRMAVTVRAANDDIWVYHFARGTFTRLTFGSGNSDIPVWTPDGSKILYAREIGTEFGYFMKPWDGSGPEVPVSRDVNGESTYPPEITSDGKTIVYTFRGDIYARELAGGGAPTPLVQTPGTDTWGRVSPDGRYLVYNSDESGRSEVYVVRYPSGGGKWQVSINGGTGGTWSKDGKHLTFLSGRTVKQATVTLGTTFDFTAPRTLYDLPPEWNSQTLDFLSDGATSIIAVQTAEQQVATQVNIVIGWTEELRQKLSK